MQNWITITSTWSQKVKSSRLNVFGSSGPDNTKTDALSSWEYQHSYTEHHISILCHNWQDNSLSVLLFNSPTQLSQRLQCEARGGRKILQVKQYFNFTVCPLMTTSFVLGGGRYPPELEPFAISEQTNRTQEDTQINTKRVFLKNKHDCKVSCTYL